MGCMFLESGCILTTVYTVFILNVISESVSRVCYEIIISLVLRSCDYHVIRQKYQFLDFENYIKVDPLHLLLLKNENCYLQINQMVKQKIRFDFISIYISKINQFSRLFISTTDDSDTIKRLCYCLRLIRQLHLVFVCFY